ncbi:MAG: CarD family transcriptional regulator [bacterium]
MTFQIGDKVVYPTQGIGTIENISERSFGTHAEKFYLLRLTSPGLVVMVPFSHVKDVGLRKVTRNGELTRVLAFLAEGDCQVDQDWKSRFKTNSEKIRVGGLLQIAEVLKCLLLLQRCKPLSFREKKMLDRARQMLVHEISISRGLTVEQASLMVRRALAKSSLSLPEEC